MRTIKKNLATAALLFGFILGNHNGYIALWETGDPEPKQIFPYQVTSLPTADQEALKDGIRLKDAGALLQLLEDYLS